jgi:hypothetical protein
MGEILTTIHANVPSGSITDPGVLLVHYIYEKEQLNQLNADWRSILTPLQLKIFNNHKVELKALAANASIEGWANWLAYLSEKTHSILGIMTRDHQVQKVPLSFDNIEDIDAWKEWPHAGETLELQTGLYSTNFSPDPLAEIDRFGRVCFYGEYGSGSIIPPSERMPIHDYEAKQMNGIPREELFFEYYRRHTHIPVEDLIPFFESSGAYLMYDSANRIWCGGIEEGDLWLAQENLEEALSALFQMYRDIEGKGFLPFQSFLTKI